jgi:hypothetical protein
MSALKNDLRAWLERRAPGLFHGIRALRNRRHFRRNFSDFQAAVKAGLFPGGGPVVIQTGPFRGLLYLDEIVWGSITPKWLGSYEAELHPVIERIVERAYPAILDVGCAEGYYAVGLAVASPTSEVFAFDTDFISRNQTLRLARLNRVADRVKVRARCDYADLDRLARGRTLVVCDIEGGEACLLDPGKAPGLSRHDILVEVHETSGSSTATEDLLASRFQATHRIERIAAMDRGSWIEEHAGHLPGTVPRPLLRQAVEEHRAAGQVWLWMQSETA